MTYPATPKMGERIDEVRGEVKFSADILSWKPMSTRAAKACARELKPGKKAKVADVLS